MWQAVVVIVVSLILSAERLPLAVMNQVKMELLQQELSHNYSNYRGKIERTRQDWRTLYPESAPTHLFETFPTDGSIFGWEGFAYDEADHLLEPRETWSSAVQAKASRLGLDCSSAKQMATPDGDTHWYAVQAGC